MKEEEIRLRMKIAGILRVFFNETTTSDTLEMLAERIINIVREKDKTK